MLNYRLYFDFISFSIRDLFIKNVINFFITKMILIILIYLIL